MGNSKEPSRSDPPPSVGPVDLAGPRDDEPSYKTRANLRVIVPGLRRGGLTILTGLNAGQTFSFGIGERVLGRGSTVDIAFTDDGVSRRHARVYFEREDTYAVEDLGSTNGTFVNGERVSRAELRTGDRIQIGPEVAVRFALVDSEEENLARKLYESSTRDALTGAFNRKYFEERLTAELAYAKRKSTNVGVLVLDLDHFKRINDTRGHSAGDLVLQEVVKCVTGLIRTEDVFARYGGEEFVVLVRGIPHAGVVRLAERIRSGIARMRIPWTSGAEENAELRVTLSIGVASLDDAEEEPADLVERADQRLYSAKHLGRNRVVSESA